MLRSLINFIGGIGASLTLSPLPYVKNPFAYPEKALTLDWELIGADILDVIHNDEDEEQDGI